MLCIKQHTHTHMHSQNENIYSFIKFILSRLTQKKRTEQEKKKTSSSQKQINLIYSWPLQLLYILATYTTIAPQKLCTHTAEP